MQMAEVNIKFAEWGYMRIIKTLYYTKQDFRSVNNVLVRRGDIFYADLNPVIGSEQGGIRPVLVVQNDVGNKYSPTVIIAAITSQIDKAKLPTHIELQSEDYGIEKDSVILLEQLRTIDKRRLKEKITILDQDIMAKVDEALKVSLGLGEF